MAQAESKIRIALIEDDPDLNEGWCEIFDLLGMDFESFRSGVSLLDRAGDRVNPFSLIITDFYLPGLDGVEVVKRFREANPAVRAIILTGSRENSVAKVVAQLANSTLIHKPVNIEALEKAIYGGVV